MEKMLNVIKNKGVSAALTTEKRGYCKLNVKGIENIFSNLFPLLDKYSHFLYWKSDSFNLLSWVKNLVASGGHHTYIGLNLLIDKLYNFGDRATEKKVWIERLNLWLQTVNSRRDGGHYYIYPIYKPNSREIRGWQVRFATSLKLPEKSNKAFICSTNGGKDKALELAIAYRERVILEMLDREGLTENSTSFL